MNCHHTRGRLSGLALVALASGLMAADAPPAERVVDLPPLTVTDTVSGPPWRYLAAPGIEVISRCNDRVTVHLVEEMHRLQQLLRVMLPEDLQVKMAVPNIAVLYSEGNKPVVSQEVVAELLHNNGNGGEEEGRRGGGEVRYRPLANLRLVDRDEVAFFFILNERDFADTDLTLTPDYIRYVVRSRTPAPPAWFVDGIVDLYNAASFDRSQVVFRPVEWDSPSATQGLKKDPEYPRALLPLTELFSAGPGPDQNSALRRGAAVLFLRWALDGKDHPRREALWKFIARASAGPVTEDIFRECFGLGYVDAQERISDYLSGAVSSTVHLAPDHLVALPRLEPRLASDVEIARIKGDLERLEIGYVRARYPQLTAKYAEQARRTLMRAYANGERDPRLLAVIGLCECDAGNDAGARKFLEAAAQGGVVRPRAYYELARLRYAEARANPALAGGRLSAAQATEVLQPLDATYRQPPPLLEMYELTAEVWSRSIATFQRRNLDVLDVGVGYFPWNPRLIYEAAWLNARQGYKAEAEALILRGSQANPDADLQTRFAQLHASLTAAAQPATPP